MPFPPLGFVIVCTTASIDATIDITPHDTLPRFRIHLRHCMQLFKKMTMNKVVVSAAVLAAGLSAVAAQGTVVGAAEPGTMDDTFTIPFADFRADTKATQDAGCGSTFAGCHGKFTQLSHEVAGKVTVLDDCTFRIEGWQFDGKGPAVEWCALLP